MPRVGFEPMTPVFERAKAYASDRAAAVIGIPEKTSNMVKKFAQVSDSLCLHLRREPELPPLV
jgi:hypothetical protein